MKVILKALMSVLLFCFSLSACRGTPTSIAEATAPVALEATQIAKPTDTPVLPTDTPTATNVSAATLTPTNTSTPTPTNTPEPPTETPTPSNTSTPTDTPTITYYRVQRLTPGYLVDVADHSLNEWHDSLAVMKIEAQDANNHQWGHIRGRTPETLSPNDLGITVYMARDAEYLYIALQVHDDKVIPGSAEYPYNGDSFELFLAGKDLNSQKDFHDHIKTSNQAAFFQLVLPAAGIKNERWDFFPEYRTDSQFRKNAVEHGFEASVWKTPSGFNAEARISLAAFESDVRNRIDRGEELKMNMDYLDYDIGPPEPHVSPHYGFLPDNVFSLDAAEENVNKPGLMRSVIFE